MEYKIYGNIERNMGFSLFLKRIKKRWWIFKTTTSRNALATGFFKFTRPFLMEKVSKIQRQKQASSRNRGHLRSSTIIWVIVFCLTEKRCKSRSRCIQIYSAYLVIQQQLNRWIWFIAESHNTTSETVLSIFVIHADCYHCHMKAIINSIVWAIVRRTSTRDCFLT